MNKIRLTTLSIALLLIAPIAHAQERGPLALAKSSYFFVGGKDRHLVEGSPMVRQMYVEYMIPARRSQPFPIVMVHGGSQTGTNFTGTPDGREGWAQYFVRRGYAVYVVDQVARGRAGLLGAAALRRRDAGRFPRAFFPTFSVREAAGRPKRGGFVGAPERYQAQ